jgi:hypothetical protein
LRHDSSLFKRKRRSQKTVPEIDFSTVAKNSCNQKFYLETLKLKANEIELFLQFCEADPNQNNCSKLQYAEYDGFLFIKHGV